MKNIACIILMVLSWSPSWTQENYVDLVWSDEFNTDGAPDPASWGYDLGHGQDGWGNREVQSYTSDNQNVRVEDGRLIIRAVKDGNGQWTSARVKSQGKKSFTYGRIVWRAKLPQGSGTWAALWLLGEEVTTVGWPASGEIDVMEHVGKWPGQILAAIHTPSSHGNTVNKNTTQINSFNTLFHDYELVWTPEKLAFYVDGQNFYTYAPSTRNSETWPFDKPFFLIMNIAMGGGLGSDPQYETDGLKNGIDPALAEAQMEVDYVRVYQPFTELKLDGPHIVRKNERGLRFKTNSLDNATYEWSVPPGAVITSGQGTAEASVDWGETEGNVRVAVTLDGATYEKEIPVTHIVKPQGSALPLHAPDFPIEWTDTDPVNEFIVSHEKEAVRIDYRVSVPSSIPSLTASLYRAVDLTDHPVLQVRARSLNASRTLRIRVDLVDENGRSTNKAPVFNLSPLIDDGAYYNYRFDFAETNQWQSDDGAVDASRITKINVFVDFGVFGSPGSDSLWIEDIRVMQREHPQPPNRPSHLTAATAGKSPALTWQDNAENESHFNVYYAPAPGGPFSLYTTTESNVTSLALAVDDGDPYQFFFKVTASGPNGESESSNVFQPQQHVTSIGESTAEAISIYPNPSYDGRLCIQLPGHTATVTITDLRGNHKLVFRPSQSEICLDLSDLPAGVYHLSLPGTSGVITRRFLLL